MNRPVPHWSPTSSPNRSPVRSAQHHRVVAREVSVRRVEEPRFLDGERIDAQACRAKQRGLALACIERRARRELLDAFVVLEDRAAVRVGELDGAADDGGEDGVEVERRADGAPDVAESRELADGARELLRPRLQLGQQPRVLDGDDGLVGERLQQLDLVIGECARCVASHRNRPESLVVTEQRDRHMASVAASTSRNVLDIGRSGIGLGVGDTERRSITNDAHAPCRSGATVDRPPSGWRRRTRSGLVVNDETRAAPGGRCAGAPP